MARPRARRRLSRSSPSVVTNRSGPSSRAPANGPSSVPPWSVPLGRSTEPGPTWRRPRRGRDSTGRPRQRTRYSTGTAADASSARLTTRLLSRTEPRRSRVVRPNSRVGPPGFEPSRDSLPTPRIRSSYGSGTARIRTGVTGTQGPKYTRLTHGPRSTWRRFADMRFAPATRPRLPVPSLRRPRTGSRRAGPRRGGGTPPPARGSARSPRGRAASGRGRR